MLPQIDRTGFSMLETILSITIIAILLLIISTSSGLIYNAKILQTAKTIDTLRDSINKAQNAGIFDSSNYNIAYLRNHNYLNGTGNFVHSFDRETGTITIVKSTHNNLRGYSIIVSNFSSNACNRLSTVYANSTYNVFFDSLSSECIIES